MRNHNTNKIKELGRKRRLGSDFSGEIPRENTKHKSLNHKYNIIKQKGTDMSEFENMVSEFMEYMKLRNMSRDTIVSYRDSVRTFIRFLEETDKISDFREVNKEPIFAYQKWLDEERVKNNLSLETIHVRLRGLKRFLEFMQDKHLLIYNPGDTIIFPQLGNRLPKDILTKDEVKKILDRPTINTMEGIRDRALLETLYSTGIRLSECANLEKSDVDYEGGYMRVNQGKGSKDRIVPLGKIACYWLKEYILKIRPEFQKRNKNDSETKALWFSVVGNKLSDQIIGRLVHSYGRKAGINKKVTVHTWRRTLATHLLQEGANPIYIQEILGHENASSLNRYIKVAAVDVKETHQKTHPRELVPHSKGSKI